MAWRFPFLRKPLPPGLAAAQRVKVRKPRTKAILLKEMAEAVADVLLKRGRNLSREEKLQLVEDNMLDAAVAISQRLAKIRDEEDFTLTDTMAMFKQVREYQMTETRRSKIDPKDKDKAKDGTPSGFVGYQGAMKDAKDKLEAKDSTEPQVTEQPKTLRITAAGEIDKRHEGTGRPPGASLARQQEMIRRRQDRMRAKEEAAAAPQPETPQGK